jgi:hypothetical protein
MRTHNRQLWKYLTPIMLCPLWMVAGHVVGLYSPGDWDDPEIGFSYSVLVSC